MQPYIPYQYSLAPSENWKSLQRHLKNPARPCILKSYSKIKIEVNFFSSSDIRAGRVKSYGKHLTCIFIEKYFLYKSYCIFFSRTWETNEILLVNQLCKHVRKTEPFIEMKVVNLNRKLSHYWVNMNLRLNIHVLNNLVVTNALKTTLEKNAL